MLMTLLILVCRTMLVSVLEHNATVLNKCSRCTCSIWYRYLINILHVMMQRGVECCRCCVWRNVVQHFHACSTKDKVISCSSIIDAASHSSFLGAAYLDYAIRVEHLRVLHDEFDRLQLQKNKQLIRIFS